MITYKKGTTALLTGTIRRSATMRHQELSKYHEYYAQIVSDFCTDKTCGNLQIQENFELYESDNSIILDFTKITGLIAGGIRGFLINGCSSGSWF